MRKRLFALVLSGRPVVWLDNVAHTIDSPVLAATLTAQTLEDRPLGRIEILSADVRCTFILTGNNLSYSTEIARRLIRCRLDPRVDRPWLREGFEHEDLRSWTDEHRVELLAAVLTIIRSWIAAGRPAFSGRSLGSFENWSKTIGGILENAGIDGFLSNLAEFYEASDTEGSILRAFVVNWWVNFQGQDVGARDLFEVALATDGFDLGRGNDRSQQSVLGRKLARLRDRVIGDYCVVAAGVSHSASRWKLLCVTDPGNLGDLGNFSYPRSNAYARAYGNSGKREEVSPSSPSSPQLRTCQVCGGATDGAYDLCETCDAEHQNGTQP
jgi:putative DNA primase/helicase